tara:strand:+ start:426 stop:1172 length:747 start_codon:yes stop_codon:yes gene_type:complete
MKKCTKCKIEKELNEFQKDKQKKDGLSSSCSVCSRQKSKIYYDNNKEKEKKRKKIYHQNNKEKVTLRVKKWYENNKEEYLSKQKIYYLNNKEKEKKRKKIYYQNNKAEIDLKKKIYQKNNREIINKNARRYEAMRRKTDPMFKLKKILRDRSYKSFKAKGYKKNSKTQEMLGVDWGVCKAHIERQFKKGMTWDNQGDWHIDHIIPLASANTIEELKKLCHYSNLQPLWSVDNIMKSDKINGQQNKFRF